MGSKKRQPLRRRRSVRLCCFVAFGGLAALLLVETFLPDDDYDEAPRPYVKTSSTEATAPHEKRQADHLTRAFREGASWGGQWRAASEPGGAYMAGAPLEARRRPRFAGGAAAARAAGFYATPSGDSVAVDALGPNCTAYGVKPPADYPADYLATDILENWPPDSVVVPPRHYASLCRFDYADPVQRKQARAFRELEVPFVAWNHPELAKVVRDWSTPGFLERRLGPKAYRAERSDDNHFMYHGGARGNLRGWTAPTDDVRMTYQSWLDRARRAHNTSILDEHYYFRVSPPDMTTRDVPIFDGQDDVFMPNPRQSKGVHCRFGYAGIIAEAHFDGSRNMVVELGGPPASLGHFGSGRRRYVLAKPRECAHAYLLPKGHPSGRHSEIDWSRPVDPVKFPEWAAMRAFEVVLEPGDVLYIPSYWLHYIISLGTNFQCNARSGHSDARYGDVHACGF